MVPTTHLVLQEIRLAPGGEWVCAGEGWRFITLRAGQAYWLGASSTTVEPGEAIMASPITAGILRASQLAAVSGSYFQFQPDRLTDLLSPVERHYLEDRETLSRLAFRHFKASDPLAIEFAAMASRTCADSSLASRSGVLRLIAAAVGIGSGMLARPQDPQSNASERFQTLLGRMTEAEFIRCSVETIALQCRCSTRHLSRLFRAIFSTSFSARQTELRMQRASRLLHETDLKIAQIAVECGYRHIGLFNATFKRRWHTTPTEWRQQGRTRNLREPPSPACPQERL